MHLTSAAQATERSRCSADLSAFERKLTVTPVAVVAVPRCRRYRSSPFADRVNSRDTFLAFVEALAAERASDAAGEGKQPSNLYGPTAKLWENTTIHDFLEAAVACARDGKSLLEQPTWRDIALFLL